MKWRIGRLTLTLNLEKDVTPPLTKLNKWPVSEEVTARGVLFFRRAHSPYLSDVVGDNYAYVTEYAPLGQEKAWAASIHNYQTIEYITSINGLTEQEALEWAACKLLELKGI